MFNISKLEFLYDVIWLVFYNNPFPIKINIFGFEIIFYHFCLYPDAMENVIFRKELL